MTPPRLLLLDRDGVINKKPLDGDYVKSISELELYLDVAIAIANATHYMMVAVVTNQQCIGKGVVASTKVKSIHKYINDSILSLGGKSILFYCCGHLESSNCICRKPKPGLLLKALKVHNCDRLDTIFLGDQETDRDAAAAAGIKFIMTESNEQTVKILNDVIAGLYDRT
jgi:D-glycero-D-manno-heptose 1,7-bisphosphate phosphatase